MNYNQCKKRIADLEVLMKTLPKTDNSLKNSYRLEIERCKKEMSKLRAVLTGF
jgi:hypothetical protein